MENIFRFAIGILVVVLVYQTVALFLANRDHQGRLGRLREAEESITGLVSNEQNQRTKRAAAPKALKKASCSTNAFIYGIVN